MSLPSQSAPRPDPEPKEAWRFEGSVKHAPAFARLNAPPTAGSCCAASLCLPSPPLATPVRRRANNALAQVAQVAPERRTLERRRRLERWQPPSPGPPAVVSSAYHLNRQIFDKFLAPSPAPMGHGSSARTNIYFVISVFLVQIIVSCARRSDQLHRPARA